MKIIYSILIILLFSLNLSSQIKLNTIKFGKIYPVDVSTATIGGIKGIVYLQKFNNNQCYGLFFEADIKENKITKNRLNYLIKSLEKSYSIKLASSKPPIVNWKFSNENKKITLSASNANNNIIISITDKKIYRRGIEIK